MKKLRFLIVAILCLFIVSCCVNTQTASVDSDPSATRDQVPEAETEPRALGMILVYGQPEAKPGEMIYAEDRRFQLDAAMFLDYIEGIKTTFMAAQNIGSSAHYFNTSNDEHKASAEAKFDSAMQGEFTVYAYDIQYDGERIWFGSPRTGQECISQDLCGQGQAIGQSLDCSHSRHGQPKAYCKGSAGEGTGLGGQVLAGTLNHDIS